MDTHDVPIQSAPNEPKVRGAGVFIRNQLIFI